MIGFLVFLIVAYVILQGLGALLGLGWFILSILGNILVGFFDAHK